MTAEEIEDLLRRAAHGHPFVYGVDPSAFAMDVEQSASLPVVGYFETAEVQSNEYGNASPVYEVYVFYDNKFKYERKGVDAAQLDAVSILRRVLSTLQPYALSLPSAFRRYDGGAYGAIYARLVLTVGTECEPETECTDVPQPTTEVQEGEPTRDPVVIISDEDSGDRYCRYGEIDTLTIYLAGVSYYETSVEFRTGETPTAITAQGGLRRVGEVELEANSTYLLAIKGGIGVVGKVEDWQ